MDTKQPVSLAAHWPRDFDERELNEIRFCRVYKEQFAHGTPGHNPMMIIAKLTDLLEQATGTKCPPQP